MPIFTRSIPFRLRRAAAKVSPLDLLVALLGGAVRRSSGVDDDVAAARRRHRAAGPGTD